MLRMQLSLSCSERGVTSETARKHPVGHNPALRWVEVVEGCPQESRGLYEGADCCCAAYAGFWCVQG